VCSSDLQLARLSLKEEEKETFLNQLNQILGYVEKLKELDTEGIEPLSHSMDLVNIVREDIEHKSLSQKEALANAPEKHSAYFRVPQVVIK